MKRFSFSRIVWILLVCLTLSVSASAYEGSYVFDEADLLSYDQAEALDNQAVSIAENYNFPVYLIIVENADEYGFDNVYDCAVSFYDEWGLGFGPDHDGELLFMSMGDRQRATVYTGYGETVFTESGRDRLDADMLSYFGNDDWAGGFQAYMDWSEYLLAEAETGTAYGWEQDGDYHPDDGDYSVSRGSYDDGPGLFEWGLTIGIPLLVALIICGLLAGQLKSVRTAAEAKNYALLHTFNIWRQSDRFTHTTETRVKIESESKSGGGGGTHHHSGGGHSGRSSGF